MPRRSLALLVAALCSACSFALVERYHEPPPGQAEPTCTHSFRWPLVDGVITAAAAGALIYAVATKEEGMPDTGRAVLAGVGSLAGVAAAVSAVYGAFSVRTCREERRRLAWTGAGRGTTVTSTSSGADITDVIAGGVRHELRRYAGHDAPARLATSSWCRCCANVE